MLLFQAAGAILMAAWVWLVSVPAHRITQSIMYRLTVRKWKIVLGWFLASIVMFVASGINALADARIPLVIAGVWLLLIAFSALRVREDSEFREYADEVSATKRAEREARKGGHEVATETTLGGGWTYSEVVQHVESVMSMSGLYPKEDFEKNPGYYLSNFYLINEIDPLGNVTITFTVPPGKDKDKLAKIGGYLSSALQYEGAEEITLNNDGQLRFAIYKTKPDTGEISYTSDTFLYTPEVNATASYRAIPFAVDSFGETLYLDLYENHTLIAGSSGGGKSVLSRNIINGIANTNAILLGIDMKQGVELALVEDRFNAVAITKEQSALLLEAVEEEMNLRYMTNKKKERPGTPWDDPTDIPIVLVIDEAAFILDKTIYISVEEKALYARIDAAMRKLFALSRAAAITIVMMTQSPKADIINTSMRNNFITSMALRTKDTNQQATILGSDASEVPSIKSDEVGAGYAIGKGFSDTTKFKAFFSDVEATKDFIKKSLINKPVLNTENGRWGKFVELVQKQWEDFISAEMKNGELSAPAVTALAQAEKLSETLGSLSKNDYDTIMGYAQANNSDYKSLIARYPDYEDLEKFAEEGEKRFG